jgi:hypothetical protein
MIYFDTELANNVRCWPISDTWDVHGSVDIGGKADLADYGRKRRSSTSNDNVRNQGRGRRPKVLSCRLLIFSVHPHGRPFAPWVSLWVKYLVSN